MKKAIKTAKPFLSSSAGLHYMYISAPPSAPHPPPYSLQQITHCQALPENTGLLHAARPPKLLHVPAVVTNTTLSPARRLCIFDNALVSVWLQTRWEKAAAERTGVNRGRWFHSVRLCDGDGRNPHLWPGWEFKLEREKT